MRQCRWLFASASKCLVVVKKVIERETSPHPEFLCLLRRLQQHNILVTTLSLLPSSIEFSVASALIILLTTRKSLRAPSSIDFCTAFALTTNSTTRRSATRRSLRASSIMALDRIKGAIQTINGLLALALLYLLQLVDLAVQIALHHPSKLSLSIASALFTDSITK